MATDIVNLAVPAALAAFTLGFGIWAFSRKNVVHGVVLLAVVWTALAGFYLWADAEFIAFAQVLVHVGAISMAALFAVLLTRRGGDPAESPDARRQTFRRAVVGVFTAVLVGAFLGGVVLSTPLGEFPDASVIAADGETANVATSALQEIGRSFFTKHVVALLATGVLLTSALLGAVVLAADKDAE